MTTKIKTTINHGKVDNSAKRIAQIQLEKQVVVHCTYKQTGLRGRMIRIWPKSLFLIDKITGFRSNLIWFENVPAYPTWKPVSPTAATRFTLVFDALPDICTTFDLCEIIPEAGGFMVCGIQRNDMDVYNISL